MRAGDFIRLKAPFTPASSTRVFNLNASRFGRVGALVTVDAD